MVELTKPFFTTIFVNLLLVLAGFQFVDTTILEDFVEVESDGTLRGGSQDLEEGVPSTGQDSSFIQDPTGSATLSLIDGLGALLDFLTLLVNVVLAPLEIMIALPNIARVFVGFPLLIFNVFGYASFIRSGA